MQIDRSARKRTSIALAVSAAVALAFGSASQAEALPGSPAAPHASAAKSVCDEAIAEAGTGQGKYGHYKLVHAPAQGGPEDDVVVGTNGPDHLVGGAGNDVLCGLGGDDVLDGGSGNDYLDGGPGNDTLIGGSGNDTLVGGPGNDTLDGGSGNDYLDGGPGYDRLSGGSGNDTLVNGEVNDGGSGNDKITPAPGSAAATDISSTMPRATRDEIVGDFLGKGHDQRMRAENASLDIYDGASYGGALLPNPAAMDLSPPQGNSGTYVTFYCGGLTGCSAPTWATGSAPFADVFHLNTIYTASNGQNIFMSGVTGSSLTIPNSNGDYQNTLYVLPPNGSCGSSTCALQTIDLPSAINTDGFDYRAIATSSIAAGSVQGTPMLAVGLTDGGLQLYNVSDPYNPQLTATWLGMATGTGAQTPVTALAFDPSGSGMLSVGVLSPGNVGYVIRVQGDGTVGGVTTWSQTGGSNYTYSVLATGWGQRADGTPVVAYSMNDSTLRLIDPANTGTVSTLTTGQAPVTIAAINAIPRFDGSAGVTDFAVSAQTVPGVLDGLGLAFRWDGSSPTMTLLNVSAGSTPTHVSSWEQFRRWYPGIKEGRLVVANSSAEPVDVTLQAAPGSSSGCWYAPAWADAPVFPAGGLPVAAGQTSTPYTMGAYTSGPDGQCAASGDMWRGYLVVTPVNHPADQRLVKLLLNPDMSVGTTEQVGGTTSATTSLVTLHAAAYGQWQLQVGTPAGPAAQTPPTVTAARVTNAAMTSGPPVYRFDLTGATLTLPNPYANQMVLPSLVAQGSTNGRTWTTLGSVVPSVAPTIVPQGSGAQLQLGPSTFWWENPAGAPAYTQIRVGFGNGQPQSAPVTLATLPAPQDGPPSTEQGPSVTAPNGTAQPVDSGIDQAPLQVTVADGNGNVLPYSDPHYARLYYRQATSNVLVTNLLPPQGTPDFIGLTPYAGAAYANNGNADTGTAGVFQGYHYLATTSTQSQAITPYISYGQSTPTANTNVDLHARAINPEAGSGNMASGLTVAGCVDFAGGTCRLAGTTTMVSGDVTPVLYSQSAGGQLSFGLLTSLQGSTAVSTLPLQHAPGAAAHPLASSPVNVSPGSASLVSASGFASGDKVDTTLVTHGLLVPLEGLPLQ